MNKIKKYIVLDANTLTTGYMLPHLGKITKLITLSAGTTVKLDKQELIRGYFYDGIEYNDFNILSEPNGSGYTDQDTTATITYDTLPINYVINFDSNDEIYNAITVSAGKALVEVEELHTDDTLIFQVSCKQGGEALTCNIDLGHLGNVTMDWGDGTIESVYASGADPLNSHIYSNEGDYTIKISTDTGKILNFKFPANSNFSLTKILQFPPDMQAMRLEGSYHATPEIPKFNIQDLPRTLKHLQLYAENGVFKIDGELGHLPAGLEVINFTDITGFTGNLDDLPTGIKKIKIAGYEYTINTVVPVKCSWENLNYLEVGWYGLDENVDKPKVLQLLENSIPVRDNNDGLYTIGTNSWDNGEITAIMNGRGWFAL